MSLRVFLSYGHDDYSDLARQVKEDLESAGHVVWFDNTKLQAGDDFAGRIEDGLIWVAEDPGNGRVVLLMTPHAVRRPDGFCLNEVAREVHLRLRVVPVMVVWCKPPLCICHIQWLDMQDCVPYSSRKQLYEDKRGPLLKALEQGMPEEGQHLRLLNQLEPIRFDADIAHHLQRFAGRQWILDRVRAWLDNPTARPVFWITGKPGVGKTALAAQICYTFPEVHAVHFCRHGHDLKSDPRKCVTSIAYQLSTQLPDYQDRLLDFHLKEIVPKYNAGTLFDTLIVQPLAANLPASQGPLVVVIDALDEATCNGVNELARLIGEQYARAPNWLRLIVTSRPERDVLTWLQRYEPFELETESDDNARDIRLYFREHLPEAVKRQGLPDSTIDALVDHSDGLFLYAEWVLEEMRHGRLSPDEPHKFPQGLASVYASLFSRQFPEVESYQQEIAPVLSTVLAAQQPLTPADLCTMLTGGQTVLRRFQDAMGSLFQISDGGIRPFHQSLVTWLTDPTKAGPFAIEMPDGDQRLASAGWSRYREGIDHLSDYDLAHLASHLAGANRWKDLSALLADSEFVERRYAKNQVYRFGEDLARCALPACRNPAEVAESLVRGIAPRAEEGFWQRFRSCLNQRFGVYHRWPSEFLASLEASQRWNVMHFRGVTLDMEKEFDQAEGVFREMLQLTDPNHPKRFATACNRLAFVLDHQAELLQHQQRYDKHQEGLDTLENITNHDRARRHFGDHYWWAEYHRGIFSYKLYRYGTATDVLKHVRKNARSSGTRVGARHQLGVIQLKLGQLVAAEKRFRKCLKARSRKPWNHRRAFEHRRLAQVCAITGRFGEALEHFDEAITISLNCGNRRYVHESERDRRVFVDAPLRLMLERPEEIVLEELRKELDIPPVCLADVFRVMGSCRMGYVEMIDRATATLTGTARSWRDTHAQGCWHATVMVLVVDRNGKIALQQRHEDESRGKWDVSVGGHQDIGDTPELAAVRETGEELALPIDCEWLVPVGRPYRFCKDGSPHEPPDVHRSAVHYVYRTNKRNRELGSLFLLFVDDKQRSKIRTGGRHTALAVRWQMLDDIATAVAASPRKFASGIKQLMHPEILAEIKELMARAPDTRP